ncbi:MAG: restriction endonuclease subunit S [Immundisolibacter sp.]|uniref:restriction endonuclease subunit S n=1 Tax=Immundisolibacter sp. TaxID=1934948 RepID=UPI003EE1B19D
MRRWPKVALGNVCTPVERFVTPTAGTTYRQLGVRLWGEGAYEREIIDGADTKYSKFNRIEANDLVVNKIWARNGSVAVATEELAGTHVSGEFPTFSLDRDRADPRWMRLITKWRGFWTLCDEKAQGTSGKNRIKPTQFLSIRVPLPPLPEQQAIVNRLDTLADKARQVNEHLDAIERDADRLLAVSFRKAIADATLRPMAAVAPSVRRSVTIDIDKRYREVGARSFGKGLFVKPDFDGADATWQKPVWINAGDVVLSNIKAWEGAIAVAGAEHDGCIASHRYITCVPDPSVLTAGFLAYFLLSAEGLEQIGFASPGTADRNRTLSLTNLGKIEVALPQIATQNTFNTLQAKVAALKARHATIRQANDALIPATLERVFSGAN